ncbi:MAG: RsmD family RNA methyltransferase [Cystobacterineae bacterium]|nr:RsmD family RNA methyltransferase [Cystobacterineae bacterium]
MDAPVDAAEWVCEVVRLAQSGEGIALWDGRALFIPGAFPKERVLAKKTAHPQRAELLKILEASPERRPPPCPHHNKCGGCDWMAVGEEAQRAFKQSLMVSTLERMGGIVEGSYTCCPMAFNQNVLGYRRRARLGRAGRRLGFRMRSSAVCTAIEFCPILVPALQHLPGAFCEAWGEEAMGEIEEVELLEGQGEIALGIWLNSKLQDKHLKLAQRARERLKAAGIWLQGRGGLAKEEGRAYLRDWGFAYMHPAVFAQSNGPMNTQLLRTLIAWMQTLVADIAKAAVLELFSGNGNFTWAISRLVRELWAIETSNLAIHLAQRMGVEKARTLQSLAPSSQPQPHNASMRFIVGDVAQVVKGLIKEAKRFDCIVLDPPRQGAAGIGGWAKQLGAQYVFYISCNPSSLARDAKELQREGFSPIRLQLFDFFPQTHHAESLMAFIKTQKP